MKTVQVMPWGKDQGEFVVINEEDFDPKMHKPFESKPKQEDKPKRQTKAQAETEKSAD